MTHDGRVSAWIGAYKRIESVAGIKQKHPEVHDSKFWQSLYEAQILTALACAPEDIGLAAGEYLAAELADEQRSTKQRRDFIERVLG